MPGESGKQLKFDLEDLYATAPAFRRAGSEIGDEVQRVTRQLESLGEFWGHDDPGRKFGSEYAHCQSKLLSLLATVAGEVEGIGDGITKMADQYGVAEQGNASKIRSLDEEK